MSPRPRPTPDDSLFADDNLKPSLQGYSSRRSSSSLLLSGLDTDLGGCETWGDEELGGVCIELTRSSSSGSSNSSSGGSSTVVEDPLMTDPHARVTYTEEDFEGKSDAEIAVLIAARPEEDEACRNDAEIAALMASQWRKQDRKRLAQVRHEGNVKMASPEDKEKADVAFAYIWLVLILLALVGGLAYRYAM